MSGDIIGEQTTTINFEYNPKSLTTAECVVKVRTSEFDSQPKTMRIVGSSQSNLKGTNQADQIWINEAQALPEVEVQQTKTLLMGARGGPHAVQLGKLPEKYQTATD